jgi:hypothetical protein
MWFHSLLFWVKVLFFLPPPFHLASFIDRNIHEYQAKELVAKTDATVPIVVPAFDLNEILTADSREMNP